MRLYDDDASILLVLVVTRVFCLRTVTPSQINRSTRSTSSSAESEQIKEMQEEINALKEKNSKIDELTQAIIFLTQRDKARKKEIELLMQMQNFSGRQVYYFDAFKVKFYEYYFKDYYFNTFF